MATELNQIIREALDLPDEDRATLAGLLIKSLEEDEDHDRVRHLVPHPFDCVEESLEPRLLMRVRVS